MSLRPTSLRAACRSLAIRSRPALPRQEALRWSVAKRQYADESNQKPSPKPQARAAKSIPETPQTRASDNAAPEAAAKHKTKVPEGFSVESSTDDAIDELESALAGMSEGQTRTDSAPREHDALAEEAAADESGITVEEALSQLEKAAQGSASSSGMEGGLTPSQEEHLYREGSIPPTVSNGDAQRDLKVLASGGLLADAEEVALQQADGQGRTHKFPLPVTPLGPQDKLKNRYHPVLDQMTNLLMRHGKKSVAQRNMAMILNYLRTSPSPIFSPKYQLLAGHPPPHHLPLNPVLYLTLAIDSVAPLIKVKYLKGAAGGGRALEMPQPLALRQRRRTAFQWILDQVNKKRSAGSGRKQLAHRIASELIAVVEGRSPVWEKRQGVHKLGTASRANLNTMMKGKKIR